MKKLHLKSPQSLSLPAADGRICRFENLEGRQLLSTLPFRLDFDASAGGLNDRDNEGTGFTSIQQNKNADGYQPALIDLDTATGQLRLTTAGSAAAGGNSGVDNTLVNALQTDFDGTGQVVEISSKLVGGLGIFSEGYEQGGIFFGPDQDNYLKLVAIYHNTGGPQLEFVDEYSDGTGGTYSTVSNGRIYVGDWSTIDTLEVRLVANPNTGQVSAFYKVDEAANWSQVPHSITIPSGKRSAFFNASSKAGLVAFDKSDAQDITVTYDYFQIQKQAPGSGPSVSAIRPASGSANILRDSFVAVDVTLPNGAIDATTVTSANVYLINNATGQAVAAGVNTTGGGDAITLTPVGILAANTSYTFHITSGVKDVAAASFQAFSSSFTTGSSVGESQPRVAFERQILSNTVGIGWTGVTFGPDGKLYGVTHDGGIYRFDISADGTLANRTELFSYETTIGTKRLITGITFDTSQGTLTAYISHGQWIDPGDEQDRSAAEWTGAITRFSGASLQTRQDVIVNLPRSVYDHLNNQPSFGPDGRLYWVQPSNTAMGAPDSTWGNRSEQLLTGAVLAADVRTISSPLDVKTADGGAYDPYATGAKVRIYATGIRNGYDLVWTDDGRLFVPANGSAAGGNTPAGPGNTPPAINGVTQTQHDYLFRIDEGGYYGHPNPLRGEYVLNGGNPTAGPDPAEVSQYPVGTTPPASYKGFAYDFGLNVSPNGIMQYQSNGAHFGGALDGKLMVVRYSGGDDLVILDLDSAGNITQAYTGSFGMTGMTDPLDVIQDPNTGNLYVVEAGFRSDGGNPDGLRISLLKPMAPATSTVTAPRMLGVAGTGEALHFSDIRGDSAAGVPHRVTITNTGATPLALPTDAFQISGSGASRFSLSGAPSVPGTIAPGASVSFDVLFAADVKGIVEATLTIKSNDAAQPIRSITLRGLGTVGEGGSNEPSLQRILDLYELPISVGDPDPETTDYPAVANVGGSDEVLLQLLQKAGSGPVRVQILASMGTANDNGFANTSTLSWHGSSTPETKNAILSIAKAYAQTVNPGLAAEYELDPSGDFGLVGTFFDFGPRDVWSQDGRNTWEGNADERRKVRFFPLKTADGTVVPNAYVFAFEEWDVASDQNDVVGIIYNVQPAGEVASLSITNRDGVPFDDRLVFSRIQWLDSTDPNLVHDTSTLRITNSGEQTLSISQITLDNSDFSIISGGTGGGTINVAPGAAHDVVVKFIYSNPTLNGVQVREGTLTVKSNAPGNPTQDIELAGLWQSHSEDGRKTVEGHQGGSQEPTLFELVRAFGYQINVGPDTGIRERGNGADTAGRVEHVGQETISAAWRAADSSKSVTVRQIVAFHRQEQNTNTTTRFYYQNDPWATTWLFQHDAEYGQSILPPLNNSTAKATGSFAPGTTPWGLKIDGSFTDPSLNVPNVANDEGHAIRWFALRDREGNLIPDAWLVAQDYAGTSFANYDYQDNLYLVFNAKPVSGPSAPTGAAANGTTSGILLSWTANAEGNLGGYNIYRSDSATGTFTKVNSALVAGASYNDAAAPSSQTSYYRIVPVDYHGTEGSAVSVSDERPTSATAPAAPSYLNATAVGYDKVTLAWTDNSNNETGFRIERALGDGSFVIAGTVGADVNTFTDTGVVAEANYRYRVFAYNEVGDSASSNVVPVAVPSDPGVVSPPSGLAAPNVTFELVGLTWNDTSDNETGFRVERRLAGSGSAGWVTVASLPSDTGAYADATVQPDTTYDYRVFAFNAQTTSPASELVSVTTPSDPGSVSAPAGLTTTAVTYERVSLAWVDASDNETGFRIERALGDGAFALLDTVGAGETSYNDLTVVADTTYRYRVLAFNGSGQSSPSNTIEVDVPSDPTQIAPPSNLRLTGLDAWRIAMAWDDDSTNETGFRVERAIGDGDYTLLTLLPAGVERFADATAQPGTAYRYRVLAYNEAAASDASNVLAATTPADPTVIEAPTSLVATSPVSTQVNLSWDDNAVNETTYVLQRRVAGRELWQEIARLGTGAQSFIDTTVTPATAYEYRLAAANALAQSDWSGLAAATTPSAGEFDSANIGDATGTTTVVTPRTGFDLTGTGGAVDGTADNLRFIHRAVIGDFDYRVHVADLDKANPASAAGLMVREGLGAGSRNVFLRTSGEVRLSFRDATGGGSGGVGLANPGTPVWLRLRRSGDVFTGFYSTDGTSWTELGQTTMTLPATLRLGVGLSSFSSSSSSVQFRDLGIVASQPPVAPGNVTATAQGARSARVAWQDNSVDEASFRVERRTSGNATWQSVGTLLAGTTSFVDDLVEPETTYEYRIVAGNAVGETASSATSVTIGSATPQAPPTIEPEVRTDRRGNGLHWGSGGPEATSYRIERRIGNDGSWEVLTEVPGRSLSLRDASAEPGVTYQYRIIAVGEGGNSQATEPVTVTTAPDVELARPELSGRSIDDDTVEVTWSDASQGETRYEVQRRLSSGRWISWATLAPDTERFVDRHMFGGESRTYRVRANGLGRVGAWSAPITVAALTEASWQSAAIGTSTGGATVIHPGRHYDVVAGGADVWSFSDEFHYVYRTVSGDFDYRVRVIGLGGSDAEAMAGLMARAGLDEGAANVYIHARPADARVTARRINDGQTTAEGSVAGSPLHGWLRLMRQGNLFTAYRSTDGATWVTVGTVTAALPSELLVGLATSAHDADGAVTARYRDLTRELA